MRWENRVCCQTNLWGRASWCWNKEVRGGLTGRHLANIIKVVCNLLSRLGARPSITRQSSLNSEHISTTVPVNMSAACLPVSVSAGVGWPQSTYITQEHLPAQPCSSSSSSSYWYLGRRPQPLSVQSPYTWTVTTTRPSWRRRFRRVVITIRPVSVAAVSWLSSPWPWQYSTSWVSMASFH